jgi:hypothetical protein
MDDRNLSWGRADAANNPGIRGICDRLDCLFGPDQEWVKRFSHFVVVGLVGLLGNFQQSVRRGYLGPL